MRTAGISALFVALLMVLTTAAAHGQIVPSTPAQPYGLDPYKPGDAAVLRSYGAALLGQTPLLELGALDPYKPSEAALLRQLGGAMTLCCPNWPWIGPTFGPLTPAMRRGLPPLPSWLSMPAPEHQVRPADLSPRVPSGTVTTAGGGRVSTTQRPESNDGIWVRYAGRTWISAGRAVPFQDAAFRRVGEYGGLPVYQRTEGDDEVIYLPATRDGLVAPYRAKR